MGDSCLFDTMKFVILLLICLGEICHDFCIERLLQPLNGESMSYRSAVKHDGARLDIAACGFWGVFHINKLTLMYVFSTLMPLLISHLAFVIMSSRRGGRMMKRVVMW